MTDHELAVIVVKRGLEVFKEIAPEAISDFEPLMKLQAGVLIPMLMVSCINATIQVHMMKQLAAALSGGREVKLP